MRIAKAFGRFKKKNKVICKGLVDVQTRMERQVECIYALKSSLFDKAFMKSIVFKAWKMYVKSNN